MSIRSTAGLIVVTAATLLAQSGGPGPSGGGGSTSLKQVSLSIPNESAPPGGMVQMKFMVTEPTPISTGRPIATLDATTFDTVCGIELFNPAGDVNGVALVSPSGIQIQYI